MIAHVVKQANQRAINEGSPDLAAVMGLVHRWSVDNAFMTGVLQAVLSQTATGAEIGAFNDYVRWAERELGWEESNLVLGVRYEQQE